MKIEYCCMAISEAIEEGFIFFDQDGAHIGRKNDTTMCIENCPFCAHEIIVINKEVDEA